MMTHQNDDIYTALHVLINLLFPVIFFLLCSRLYLSLFLPKHEPREAVTLSLSLFQKTFVLRAARDMY